MTCQNCGNEIADQLRFCPKCGTPSQSVSNSPPVYQQPAWQSSPQPAPVKRKSRTGKILLIIGIIVVLLGAGIGVAIYFGVRSYMHTTKSSAAYALAETTLRSSERVKERLGEIKTVGVPIGTFKEESDGTGFAAFVMSVEGEKAGGQYIVAMDRWNSVWRVQTASVQLPTGEEIKVVDELKDKAVPEPIQSNVNDNENQNLDTRKELTDVEREKLNTNSIGPGIQSERLNTDTPPPPPPPINANRESRVVSGGVLNGKAISLPRPAYPAIARAARVSGSVSVQVTIDEQGSVISASAVSGPPLLRASAVSAARQARFSPTRLSGEPVKVKGTIIYNFVL